MRQTFPGMVLHTAIPSPSQGTWHLGPLPLRAYGIIIVIGMGVALWITARRYARRGGDPELMYSVALWAIPLGIVGARIYHVITSPDAYFGPDGDLARIPQIWTGGLGIWGGVALGAVGAWIAVRRAGQRLGPLADSVAPALLVAQAIGRWGNWFNQELFGAPTTLPWGLQIDAAHMPAGYPEGTLFHPTFLYECLWNLAMAGVIVWLDRRFRFHAGQVFSLYVLLYACGRIWIEMLRIDDAQHILGLRLNVWTSIVVIAAGLSAFFLCGRHGTSTCLTEPERLRAGTSDEADTHAAAVIAVNHDSAATPADEHSGHEDCDTDAASMAPAPADPAALRAPFDETDD